MTLMSASEQRQITLLRGREGLQTIEPLWHAAERNRGDIPFYRRCDWHLAWCDALEPDPEQLLFALMQENGELRGVLPLLPTRRSLSVGPLELWVPRRPGMDLGGLVLAPSQSLADWWPVWTQAMHDAGLNWQVLHISGVPLEPEQLAMLQGLEKRTIIRRQGHRCWFDCQGDYEQIAARYRSRLKKILRRGRRQLERNAPLSLASFTGRKAIDQAYPEFLRLESSGWKARKQTTLAQDRKQRDFLEGFLFADNGSRLQVNLLMNGDNAIAAQLCYRSGKTISLLKIAHDETCAKSSPGSLLLDELLRQCCETPDCAQLDLVTGLPWMENWGARHTGVADLWLFKHQAAARAAGFALSVKDRLKAMKKARQQG